MNMHLQIESVETAGGRKIQVVRDIERVRRLIYIADMAINSIRDFPCGHKPNGESGKCDACEAVKLYDELCT